jgi:hypothetical protein
MALRRLGPIAFDGTTINIAIGRTIVPCLKASYGDKLETQTISNMGSQKIDARTPGTYSTEEVSLTFESTKFRELVAPRLQVDGFGNERLQLVVAFSHPDIGYDSDLLDNCRITNGATALENSNKAAEVELKLTTDQIYWTQQRKTINKRDLSRPLSATRF